MYGMDIGGFGSLIISCTEISSLLRKSIFSAIHLIKRTCIHRWLEYAIDVRNKSLIKPR